MPKPRTSARAVILIILAIAGLRLAASPGPEPGEPLTAHEWGTFTALQDDDGAAVGAINADDEPVPWFVYTNGTVQTVSARSELSPLLAQSKGIVSCHPGVTMRLETPVIYFYPPANGRQPAPVNVHVTFRGGWLTEYFPRAEVEAPELEHAWNDYPPLTGATRGGLAWNGLELGAMGDLTPTDDPVWTTPREVPHAAVVKMPLPPDPRTDPNNRAEKFLFYRGVGHLDSPLRVVRDSRADRLSLYPDLSAFGRTPPAPDAADLRVPAAWLIEIRPEDGFCAFRPVPGTRDLRAPAGQALASLPASFAPADFSARRLQELHDAMHGALVAAGLFPDEAAAMLKTWELSYFKSPGRRLFYLAPRAWTDEVLPLTIDGARISRAMMGRVELVTPAQRECLARIAAGPCPDMRALAAARSAAVQPWWQREVAVSSKKGASPPWHNPSLAELHVAAPAVYQDYVDLGRFRDALVLREQQQRPTAALLAFIEANGLRAR